MENTKNMSKLSFEFFLFAKIGTETNSGSKPELDVTKMCIFETVLFLVFTLYNHNSLYKKNSFGFHMFSLSYSHFCTCKRFLYINFIPFIKI